MGKFYIAARKWGNRILHRYITADGKEKRIEVEFKPILFMKDNTQRDTYDRRSMIGDIPLSAIQYENIKEFNDAVTTYARMGVVYGQNKVEPQFISRAYRGEIQFDVSKIRLCGLDIEVRSPDGFPRPEKADHPVTAITHYDSIDDKYYVFSLADWDAAKSVLDPEVVSRIEFRHFETEKSLLLAWVGLWTSKCPATVTGWSTNRFDLPYLYNRLLKMFGEITCKSLSPFNVVRSTESLDKYGEIETSIDIYGVNCLDYNELYRKFTFKPRESYKLNYISYVELGEKKIDYSDEGSLEDLYAKNPQKYVDYNVLDVVLVLRLDKKLQLLPLAYFVAYTAKINPDGVYSPVNTWDALVFNHLDAEGRSPQIVVSSADKVKYEGAYVKEPQIGEFESVVSFDVASLYPSIIRQWNMCPSTLNEELSLPYGRYVEEMLDSTLQFSPDVAVCANGVAFNRDVPGVFPILVEKLFNERKRSKTLSKDHKKAAEKLKAVGDMEGYSRESFLSASFDAKQGAIKVLLNSLYGATGNIYFRYFDLRIAEGITRTGQVVIRWVENDINLFLNRATKMYKDRVLAIDTDSVYITLKDVVDAVLGTDVDIQKKIDFLDKSCKMIEEKVIKTSFERLRQYCGCAAEAIEMKREAIASKAFWLAAKAYALDVYDMEGVRYAEPDLKSTGLKLVKSETPEFCRKALGEAIKILLRGSNPDRAIEFIDKTRIEFHALAPHDMASTKTVNEIGKYEETNGSTLYKKGTPQHSKASIVYNHLLVKHDLQKKFERVKRGEKVKVAFLSEPNPAKSDVIGFPLFLPKELGLHEYLDVDGMFLVNFRRPLEDICKVLKIKTERVNNLEDFFS